MLLKDNKLTKTTIVLIAVGVLTAAIGVAVSAQVGPRRGPDGAPGAGGPGPGMHGQGMPGPMGGHGRGMRGGPGGGPFGGPLGMIGGGLRALDLTDAQHEQVRSVMETHHADLQAIRERLMAAREALHGAVTSGAVDEQAVRAAAAEVGKVEGDAAVLHAKVHNEVFALLTPEQQQKAQELRSNREKRMKEGRDRVRQRIEKRIKERIDERLDDKLGRPETV